LRVCCCRRSIQALQGKQGAFSCLTACADAHVASMGDTDETKPDVGNMEHVNIKVKSQVRTRAASRARTATERISTARGC